MRFQNFDGIKHFSPDERWGDPSKISRAFLLKLDAWREALGQPFYVTFGTQGKHVAQWHPLGLAADGVIDIRGRSRLDVILLTERFNFGGIGIYPLARHPSCSKPLGVHLDDRPLSDPQGGARWLAIPDPKGKAGIKQLPWDAEHFAKLGII